MKINYYAISSVIFLIFGLVFLQLYSNSIKNTDFLDQEVVKLKRETCYNQKVVLDKVRIDYKELQDLIKGNYIMI